jgi:uncharacterized protein YbbC (DUF1343 family)
VPDERHPSWDAAGALDAGTMPPRCPTPGRGTVTGGFQTTPRVRTGLDRVAAGDPAALTHIRGRRVALVAHPASVDASLRHARDVLRGAGARIELLLGPEHGFGGSAQDMVGVGDARDPVTGAVVRSLYGATEDELSPRREWLAGLDAVVIDLQDVGSRYYTFVWTAVLVLRAAAAAGVPTVVLDRPNPLDGMTLEGAPQRPGHRSFVGLCDVPVRHGLTIGEVCRMARAQDGLDPACLEVVPMEGWSRAMRFDQTGLPWVLPSPNMPTLDTARVYPGGCLIEGTSLSEGRGTTRPFEIWGAPGIDGEVLAARCAAAARMGGARLRPLTFEPTFHKHARTPCGGVQVHEAAPGALRSYALYARLLFAVKVLFPDALRWRTEAYEYRTSPIAIDLLTGGPEFREAVDARDESALEAWLTREEAGAAAFAEARAAWMLYA